MSKRFKSMTCAYCGEPGISSTGDHVIPRQFVPRRFRANLPKVPACADCNNAKSADEHYLATVMPFGGNHPESSAMLRQDVPRRLERNRKLHQELAEGRGRVKLDDGGVVASTITLPIEALRITRFTRRVIQGLHAYHWGPIPKDTWIGAGLLAPAGVKIHHDLMNRNGVRLRGDIGEGLFTYAALRSFGRPYQSAWWLRMFGGVMLGGDAAVPGYVTRDLYGLVANTPLTAMFPD